MLTWEGNEPNRAKTFTVQALPGQPVRVIKVTSGNPKVQVKLDQVKPDSEYVITVIPDSTTTPRLAALNIDTLLKGEPRSFIQQVQIKASSH